MKKKYGLILPALALLSMSACAPVNTNGSVDGGGQVVESKNAAIEQIARSCEATTSAAKEGKGVAFKFNAGDIKLSNMDTTKNFGVDANLKAFTLNGAVNLLDTGAVEAKFTTPGIGLDINAKIQSGEEEKNINLNLNTGEAAFYFANDKLYADLSNNNFADAVLTTVETLMGETGATMLRPSINKAFANLKLSFDLGEVTSDILPSLSKTTPSEVSNSVKNYLNSYVDKIEAESTLTFDDFCKVYTYESGKTGIQLLLDDSVVNKLPASVASAVGNSGLKVALMTDDTNVFNKVSLSTNVKLNGNDSASTSLAWDFSFEINSFNASELNLPDLTKYSPYEDSDLASLVTMVSGLAGNFLK